MSAVRLSDRLLAALEAGQLVVERAGAASRSREGIDRICDLRVDDHAEPIVELRRLVGLWHAWIDART